MVGGFVDKVERNAGKKNTNWDGISSRIVCVCVCVFTITSLWFWFLIKDMKKWIWGLEIKTLRSKLT